MLRSIASAAVLLSVAAEVCTFTRHQEFCQTENGVCNDQQLCAPGFYCQIDKYSDKSYSGRCAVGPKLEEKYQKPCDLSQDRIQCQFDDPLALTPYAVSSLQCVRASVTSQQGQCLLGPQKHGDGCSQELECASGNCLKEIRICKGSDEGEDCTPGQPDPCGTDHYCQPNVNTRFGGLCAKTVNPGKVCTFATACSRGTFCSGPDLTFRNARCLPPFSVDNGQNTTIGPYMCKSGNALIVAKGTDLATSVYQCVEANTTRTGELCDSRRRSPMGYECKCSEDGQFRLRTIMALGLGGRSQAFKDLYQCLLKSENPMGDACQFDSLDLETVRYGSCAFYACYPYYLRLVNATGGRIFAPPLSQFEPTAQCEAETAAAYYKKVADTPCLTIPHLDNWKCASLEPPSSLAVSATATVIAFIFIIMGGGYIVHMYIFRKKNHTSFKIRWP